MLIFKALISEGPTTVPTLTQLASFASEDESQGLASRLIQDVVGLTASAKASKAS